jgi:hypothetical protein
VHEGHANMRVSVSTFRVPEVLEIFYQIYGPCLAAHCLYSIQNERYRCWNYKYIYHAFFLIAHLDVDIGAHNCTLESAFLNFIVWLHIKLRFGIRNSIPWNWTITRNFLLI